MWGIFLVFRLMFLVIGPFLIWWRVGPGFIYCLASWTSGPIGMGMAEWVHNKNLREETEEKKLAAGVSSDSYGGATYVRCEPATCRPPLTNIPMIRCLHLCDSVP
jgi:hypothetical protein